MRQFGMHQPIPVPRLMEHHAALHRMTRNGRFSNDWIQTNRPYYDHWKERAAHVENGTHGDDMTNASIEYMTWYWQRTVIYITNPSTSIGFQEGFQGDGSTTECLVSIFFNVLCYSLLAPKKCSLFLN